MRKPEFKIAASQNAKNRYKELLRHEYNDAALEESLGLLRRVLESASLRVQFDWERERSSSARKEPYRIGSAASDSLRDFLEQLNASLPREMPDELPDETVLGRRAIEAAVLLTIQSRVTLQGDGGFVRDIQSLLFQLCIHVLSPRLASRHLYDADAFLLHALHAHPHLAWTDEPAHQNYLLSSLYEHAGNRAVAMKLLRASLNNSSTDDHDFITKAQGYWSLLMESKQLEEAKSFVLELYRRAAAKNLPEIEELLDETYAAEGHHLRAS